MQIHQKITPFLSLATQAEAAANFYVSILPDSRIVRIVTNPMNSTVLTVEFVLAGMNFVALNAGQDWKFTEAFSLSVACDTQEELDSLWTQLTADGGREVNCGWLQDKFGMWWQLVPSQLGQWLAADDPVALQRMFTALWQMKKLDISALQNAFDGKE